MSTTIKITRTFAKFIGADNATEGVRLELEVGGEKFPAIERGGNCVQIPVGVYAATCDHYRPRSNPKLEFMAIRFDSVNDNNHFLIHAANWPHQLEGCIAPGHSIDRYGVNHSRDAMTHVFRLIGGWVLGKKLTIEIIEGSCRALSANVPTASVAFNR